MKAKMAMVSKNQFMCRILAGKHNVNYELWAQSPQDLSLVRASIIMITILKIYGCVAQKDPLLQELR